MKRSEATTWSHLTFTPVSEPPFEVLVEQVLDLHPHDVIAQRDPSPSDALRVYVVTRARLELSSDSEELIGFFELAEVEVDPAPAVTPTK